MFVFMRHLTKHEGQIFDRFGKYEVDDKVGGLFVGSGWAREINKDEFKSKDVPSENPEGYQPDKSTVDIKPDSSKHTTKSDEVK